jgi:hypothetical protein
MKECIKKTVQHSVPRNTIFVKISVFLQVWWRNLGMTCQEKYNVKEERKNVVACSSAIDESTDVTDTAQLAVFIRDVDEDFQLVDEPLELVSLKAKQILVEFFLNS